jgi:hypothetical protein
MPRYYFDLWEDGDVAVDDEGMELRDIKAAREEAARSLGDMARDAFSRSSRNTFTHDMAIEVRDAAGPVLQVKLSLAISQANR